MSDKTWINFKLPFDKKWIIMSVLKYRYLTETALLGWIGFIRLYQNANKICHGKSNYTYNILKTWSDIKIKNYTFPSTAAMELQKKKEYKDEKNIAKVQE